MPVPRVNVPRSLRGLAAFQTITTGRIWVIPEGQAKRHQLVQEARIGPASAFCCLPALNPGQTRAQSET